MGLTFCGRCCNGSKAAYKQEIMTKQERLRYEYFIETGIVWIDTNDNIEIDYLKWLENKVLSSIHDVRKSLNADELIHSLGIPNVDNEYLIKPDNQGKWHIEHKHVGSGEPLKQWLTGKP